MMFPFSGRVHDMVKMVDGSRLPVDVRVAAGRLLAGVVKGTRLRWRLSVWIDLPGVIDPGVSLQGSVGAMVDDSGAVVDPSVDDAKLFVHASE